MNDNFDMDPNKAKSSDFHKSFWPTFFLLILVFLFPTINYFFYIVPHKFVIILNCIGIIGTPIVLFGSIYLAVKYRQTNKYLRRGFIWGIIAAFCVPLTIIGMAFGACFISLMGSSFK